MATVPPGRTTRAASASTASGSRTWLTRVWATASVEARGREVELVRVADDEPDPVADAVVRGEPPGGRDELRALVDPRDRAGEAVACRDRARDDAGAAAEVQRPPSCAGGR